MVPLRLERLIPLLSAIAITKANKIAAVELMVIDIDILSRGIDIKGIELVINYEVPYDAEDYIHRIGRTARADKTGEAITFINEKQTKNFMNIEKLIEKNIEKINLPKGFENGPKYEILQKKKRKKNWKKNFKK